MSSAIQPSHESEMNDEFDAAVEEFMRDLPAPGNDNLLNHAPARDIDEEVKVTRKRKQVQKLDDALLLSERGIPRLRKISKDRIRFKGKGHEFSDISRLLNTYQLWLDDLYPKAKFKDALAMVEKLGHSRRMQVTRRAWIDSSKPNRAQEDEERIGDVETIPECAGTAPGEEHSSGMLETQAPEEDELDALLNGREHSYGAVQASAQTQLRKGPFDDGDTDGEPGEDELDALLVGETIQQQQLPSAPRQRAGQIEGEPDEDDLDALLAAETASSAISNPFEQNGRSGLVESRQEPSGYDDEEELAASMGW